MDSYFVRENRQGGYLKNLTKIEIEERLSNGEIKENFLVTKSNNLGYEKLIKDESTIWRTVEELLSSIEGVDSSIAKTLPISSSYERNNIPSEYRTEAISVLRFFAWLDLVFGIICSIVIWVNYGSTEVFNKYYYSTSNVANPIGIGLGIGVLMQGIFLCAFFLVVASMAENLSAIRKNTESKLPE